jgi:heme-degrading monooxygenase HmoA
MLARVITSEGKPEQLEAVLRYFRENVGPAARKMMGFKGAYFLVDRKTGKTLGMALWDTEEHLQASAQMTARLGVGMAQAAGATRPPAVAVCEVAVQL